MFVLAYKRTLDLGNELELGFYRTLENLTCLKVLTTVLNKLETHNTIKLLLYRSVHCLRLCIRPAC